MVKPGSKRARANDEENDLDENQGSQGDIGSDHDTAGREDGGLSSGEYSRRGSKMPVGDENEDGNEDEWA